ncbi:MAG: cytochrome-c peroxidase [Vicinamibacterales bacterium]
MTTKTAAAAAAVVVAAIASAAASTSPAWTADQLAELRSLSLAELDPLPPDPTNHVADDPRAAALGARLFADTRLSANGRVACSTCHRPDRGFQDGTALGTGVGTTARRTMPIGGAAWAPFLFWDGRKDSLWAQALGPLESPVEHGGTRGQYAHAIAESYRAEYEAVFGPVPDLAGVPAVAGPTGSRAAVAAWAALTPAQQEDVTRVFVNIGKAVAAFERQVVFGASRFDAYVTAVTAGRPGAGILSDEEIDGLRLFIGKAGCTQCHNGPLFTNFEFHNTGVPPRPGLPADSGRLAGTSSVVRDEFNCRSRWSDARDRCDELRFMAAGEPTQERAYKVPSLRNVVERAPYMDAGQFASLREVLDHYNRAPRAAAGRSELRPLRLTATDLRRLEAFLGTLSGSVSVRGPALTGPAR